LQVEVKKFSQPRWLACVNYGPLLWTFN